METFFGKKTDVGIGDLVKGGTDLVTVSEEDRDVTTSLATEPGTGMKASHQEESKQQYRQMVFRANIFVPLSGVVRCISRFAEHLQIVLLDLPATVLSQGRRFAVGLQIPVLDLPAGVLSLETAFAERPAIRIPDLPTKRGGSERCSRNYESEAYQTGQRPNAHCILLIFIFHTYRQKR
jgi:hypothetical protein